MRACVRACMLACVRYHVRALSRAVLPGWFVCQFIYNGALRQLQTIANQRVEVSRSCPQGETPGDRSLNEGERGELGEIYKAEE